MLTKDNLLNFNLETLPQYFERVANGTRSDLERAIEQLSVNQCRKFAEWSRVNVKDTSKQNEILTLITLLK